MVADGAHHRWHPDERTLPALKSRGAGLLVDEWLVERQPPADLAQLLACTWRGDIGEAWMPLPDECVDIYWVNGAAWVSGPETRSWPTAVWPAWPGTRAIGVRFQPGMASAFLGVAASELRDVRVPLDAVWGTRLSRELAERLSGSEDDRDRAANIENAMRVMAKRTRDPDPFAAEVSAAMRAGRTASARNLARATDLSERQLHRRCAAAFGYGPAFLLRINRVQRFLRLARDPSNPHRLADLAVAAGYADQPHLTREIRSIMETTPKELIRISPRRPIGSRRTPVVGDMLVG